MTANYFIIMLFKTYQSFFYIISNVTLSTLELLYIYLSLFFFSVTLYKCPLLGSHGGRADCSLCLTRDRKYQCAWCDGSCKFGDACLDPVATTCPPPRIDWVRSAWFMEMILMLVMTNSSILFIINNFTVCFYSCWGNLPMNRAHLTMEKNR